MRIDSELRKVVRANLKDRSMKKGRPRRFFCEFVLSFLMIRLLHYATLWGEGGWGILEHLVQFELNIWIVTPSSCSCTVQTQKFRPPLLRIQIFLRFSLGPWSRSDRSFACFTHCQEFSVSNFYRPTSLMFFFFSPNPLQVWVMCELDFYSWFDDLCICLVKHSTLTRQISVKNQSFNSFFLCLFHHLRNLFGNMHLTTPATNPPLWNNDWKCHKAQHALLCFQGTSVEIRSWVTRTWRNWKPQRLACTWR